MTHSPKDIAAIRWYVTECTRNVMRNNEGCAINDRRVEERIASFLSKQPPLTKSMILWRGHEKSPSTISSASWFSTSEKMSSAKNLFTNNVSGCCLFKIHVMPGIRVINVSATLKSRSPRSPRSTRSKRSKSKSPGSTRSNSRLKKFLEEEHEWIVEGGGVFYTNKEGTQRGFHEHDGILETYYYPRGTFVTPKKLSVNELVTLVDEMEYEFVDSPDYFDYVIPSSHMATPKTKQDAYKKIQEKLES